MQIRIYSLSLLLIVAGLLSASAQNYTWSTIAGNQPRGSTDGLGGSARFNDPQGIAADRAGHLYVADAASHTIRRLTRQVDENGTNWLVATIAGTPGVPGSFDGPGHLALFSTPLGIAVDAAG